MTEPVRLLCLPRFGRLGASSRLRTHQYVPYLRAAGFEVDVAPLISDRLLAGRYERRRYATVGVASAFWDRVTRLMADRHYDLVWIEKEVLPWVPDKVESRLLCDIPYCLDLDDATFHRYDQHRSGLIRWLLGRKVDRLMAGAMLVVAGNEYLADRAVSAGADWIELVPTVVDLKRYETKDHTAEAEKPIVVWIGSPSTSKYLGIVSRALADLERIQSFELRVIGGVPDVLAGAPADVRPWSEATEVELIRECDIGIMPIPDLPWERGKCAYKLIQYMACGLPTVASPVGANRLVVEHGSSGWLAEGHDEWVGYLSRLLGDPFERAQFGERGRKRVEEQYALEVQGPRVAELLMRVVGSA